jgi:uncharacterized repeat protein (TIGR02543 family)
VISAQATFIGKTITNQIDKFSLDVNKAVSIVNGVQPSNAKDKLVRELITLTKQDFNSQINSKVNDIIRNKIAAEENAKVYLITYQLNSGVLTNNTLTSFNITQLPLTLPLPTRSGFNFNGWFENPSFTGTAVIDIPANTRSNKIYYARWSNTDYLITYNLNNGTLPSNALTTFTVSNLPYTLPNPTLPGFTFNGWLTNEALTGSAVTSIPSTTRANVIYFARWTPINYTISYTLNSGIQQAGAPTSYNGTQLPLTLPTPTRVGYTFDGWFANSTFTGLPKTQLEVNSISNRSLFAKWSLIELKPIYIDINSVSVGHSSNSILSQSGELFSWGANSIGELGIGVSNSDGVLPLKIPMSIFSLNQSEKIINISNGASHSSALTNNGRVFMWGYNFSGQLGNGNKVNQISPVEITRNFNLQTSDRITYISIGAYHSSAISAQGRVFMWGNNEHAQLGLGFKANSPSEGQILPIDMTAMFAIKDDDKIESISIGWGHTLALSEKGVVYAYGYNEFGQLGTSSNFSSFVPTDITSQFLLNINEYVVSVSAGYDHSSAVTNLGRLFMWGRNQNGQLGDGSIVNRNKPNNNKYFDDRAELKIKTVISGYGNTAAISTDGQLLVWGSNYFGQVGNDSKNDAYIPVNITTNFNLKNGEKVNNVSLGLAHLVATTSENRLFVWGSNGQSRLGIKNIIESLLPIELIIFN